VHGLWFASEIYAACTQAKETRKGFNMNPVDATEWGLPDDHEYSSIIDLNDDNFGEIVLKSEDAWIVVFYDEKLQR